MPPGVERQVPGMPIEELLDFCAEREVEIYTRYDFISDSLIVKMRKKGLETEEIIPRKEAASKGFGLTIRVILRVMADRLGKEAEHDN